MTPEFWQDRRVFITGHTGFKGAWLSEWLLALGARPTGFALAPQTNPNLFSQLGLAGRMPHHMGDIRDFERLQAAMREADPQIVFHLAAQPLVRYSYDAPLETYSVNVMGTAHVIEACRALRDLRAVVVVTSDKCYENVERLEGYRENETLGGHDPYSSSKACAELVVSSFRRSFFKAPSGDGTPRLATARAGNVVGGGDWAIDRLIPDLVRAFAGGQSVAIRHPDSVRPWQHVLDVLRGYLMLAEALCRKEGDGYAEPWNFGPQEGNARSVRWVVEQLCKLLPENAGWHVDPQVHVHEASSLRLDSSKAQTRLGWSPALSSEEALQLTADWYREYSQGGDLGTVTRRQLSRYMRLINEASA